jgi:hypothetical protein
MRDQDDEQDVPGNIHWTGEEQLNRVTKDCGVKRYTNDPRFGLFEDDNGKFVKYHNYCAAIRTKVSTIHYSNRVWNALVVLAHELDRDAINRLQAQFPPIAADLETAFERSRDNWEAYKQMTEQMRASEDDSET